MVEGERQPGRPAWRWIDDVLMCCDKDIKGAVMMTKDRQLEKICVYWRAPTVPMTTGLEEKEDKLMS